MEQNMTTLSLTIEERIAFIKQLELPNMGLMSKGSNSDDGPDFKDDTEQVIVTPGSVDVTDKSLTGQQKQDIADAKLLAQLVTDKTFDVSVNPMGWYKSYTNVLSRIGFLYSDIKLLDTKVTGEGMTVEKVILEILAAALGGNKLDIFKSGIDALNKLGEGSDTLKVFEQKSSSKDFNNVKISYASLGEDGSPTISLATLLYSSSKEYVTFLFFFHYELTNLSVKTGSTTLSLNEKVYAQLRDTVQEKLGASAKDFIDNLDI